MALTLEGALGRPIQDLEDAILAHAMHPFVKRQYDEPREMAEEYLNNLSNVDLIQMISIGLQTLKDEGKLS